MPLKYLKIYIGDGDMTENRDLQKTEVKLSKLELEAIKLVDIEKIKVKKCAKKMKITVDEFEEILNSARTKIAKNILDGNTIKIIVEEEQIDNTLYFTFRCATCGTIYKVTGYEERIHCPLCESNKVMSLEESGFDKKGYWC
ncbi:DUF134 domain-containing protein [Paeniclostridium sordellii]|nr:DUF134 domain-containing protein [Paeniclostridium sordellii]MSB58647.1 DUF134 domain-containing protein [Paeniclostridium sordellii]MVO71920.1 DUF134 domain-containing protein [Paeniclostridium sordellii]TAN67121.1 DUF134 domain-containing protein [Paeniclostridium sordellii 8483]